MEHAILSKVHANNPQSGWAVFHFAPASTLWGIVWKLIFMAMCGFGVYVLAFMPVTIERTTENYYFAVGIGVIGVGIALSFLANLRRLIMGDKTVMVITDDTIVKSYCGKVEEFKLADVRKLVCVQYRGFSILPAYRIEFVDGRTNRFVELANNRIWGNELDIFGVLNSKLS